MPARTDTVYPPPLPPSQVVADNTQLQAIYQTFRDAIMQGKLTRGATRRTYGQARADIRRALQENISDVEAGNIERGTLGSSTDYEARVEQHAAAGRALADALAQKSGGIEQSLLQDQMTNTTYQTGLLGLGLGKAASQAELTAGDLGAGTGPFAGAAGGGGAGGGEKVPTDVANANKMLGRLFDRLSGKAGPGMAVEGPEVAPIISRIRRLWHQRNQIRRQMGLSPLPQELLRQKLQSALSGLPPLSEVR